MIPPTTFASVQQTKHLRLLLELGHDLLAAQTLDQLLQTALQRAMRFSGHDGGSILLANGANTTLEVRASAGVDAVPVGTLVDQLEKSISGCVMATKQLLVIHGRGEELGTEWRAYTRAIPSVVCLPLLLAGTDPIGVLSLKSTVVARQLDLEDLDTLQLLASLLAAAITNNRLHEERAKLLEDLALREQQLQYLVEQQLNAHEEERRRVAYDLHDGLAQIAVSTYQHLQAFASRYHSRSETNRQALNRSIELAQRTVQEARHVIAGLRPTALDDLGLTAALQMEIEERWSHEWDIRFEHSPAIGRLPAAVETALFRVTQEAFNNIHKHATTKRVHVALVRDADTIHLEVRDWGRGFESSSNVQPGHRGKHIGLLGMKERVHLLGGTFEVRSMPDQGTTIVATIPLTNPATSEIRHETSSKLNT